MKTPKLRRDMIQDKGVRIYQTLKDVEVDILGEARLIPELKVSYTMDGDGKVSRCISFEEWNKISDDINRMLRARRRVYHGND